jgi:hypothetical protein
VIERTRERVSDANDDRGFLPGGVWEGFDYRAESAKLLRGFMSNPKSYGPYTDDGTRWAMLQEVIDTCRARGARLTIVLPPSHALDMEMLWVSGNWNAFESWKRGIVEMVEKDNARALAEDAGGVADLGVGLHDARGPERGRLASANRWGAVGGHERLARDEPFHEEVWRRCDREDHRCAARGEGDAGG